MLWIAPAGATSNSSSQPRCPTSEPVPVPSPTRRAPALAGVHALLRVRLPLAVCGLDPRQLDHSAGAGGVGDADDVGRGSEAAAQPGKTRHLPELVDELLDLALEAPQLISSLWQGPKRRTAFPLPSIRRAAVMRPSGHPSAGNSDEETSRGSIIER